MTTQGWGGPGTAQKAPGLPPAASPVLAAGSPGKEQRVGAGSQARLPGAAPSTERDSQHRGPAPAGTRSSCGASAAPPWGPDVEGEAVLTVLSCPCWEGQRARPKSASVPVSGAPGSNGTVSRQNPAEAAWMPPDELTTLPLE